MVGGSLGVARILITECGLFAIAWSLSTIPTFRRSAVFASVAERVLSGEKYKAEQLKEFRRDIDALSAESFRPAALRNFVAIRVRLVEAELKPGNTADAALRIDELKSTISLALGGDPAASFVWLTGYWLQRLQSANVDARLRFLRMSYLTGPNEGWIAVKRSALALSELSSLPPDLSKQVVGDFVGLVRSGLYGDAATVLGGPGWLVRETLLAQLAGLDESVRRNFDNAVKSQNLEDVAIPGKDERTPRRY